MADIVYEVVEHDGGWAYKLNGVFSETFRSHDEARRAADRVAAEQRAPGEGETISYQDERGRWHEEASAGSERPTTDVKG